MSTLSVNGKRAVTATVTLPMFGAWSADIVMADGEILDGAATLVIGDLTLKGTVVRQGSFAGSLSTRIVAGADGWRKELPSKGYSHVVGVKLSTVLGDVASESGESISVASDRSVGTFYTRDKGKARDVLSLLIGETWWIDNDGVTQTGARASTPIVTPFTVSKWDGAHGQFEIATEAISNWTPGRTFATSTVPLPQTISSVTIESDNNGKLRLHVLSTDATETERLRSSLRSLIRAELATLLYAGVWEYSVAPSLGLGLVKTIDCTPTDSRMPALTNVPLVGLGDVAAPVAGTSCRIRFVNCDPARPECVALGSTTEHLMTTEATVLLIYNVLVAWCAAAGGGPLLAAVLQPLIVPAILAAMAAQSAPAPPGLIAQTALNAIQSGTMAAGTAPSPAIGALAAGLSLMSTKTLDVSGFFPGIGVPNGS